MRLYWCTGGFPPQATLAFPGDQDAFAVAEVWRALHGCTWESVLVRHEDQAMLHVIRPQPIPGTGLRDIEPFYGYAGPKFTSGASSEFASQAWRAYSAQCAARGIVAELLRLRPLDSLQFALMDSVLGVRRGRPIVYVAATGEPGSQQRSYHPAARRRIRSAQAWCAAGRAPGVTRDWERYQQLAHVSLMRNGAAARWHLDAPTVTRIAGSPAFELWAAARADTGTWLSATIVLRGDDGVDHSLFVANAEPSQLRGAHELLTDRIVESTRARGGRLLCLGGGRSDDPEDRLLRFKRRFNRSQNAVAPLPTAFAVHDHRAYERLASGAPDLEWNLRLGQSIATLGPVMPYRLTDRHADPGCLPLTSAADPLATP